MVQLLRLALVTCQWHNITLQLKYLDAVLIRKNCPSVLGVSVDSGRLFCTDESLGISAWSPSLYGVDIS